jgi:IS1 family transposase
MNKLDRQARVQILHMLCEGTSIRAITRVTGVSKNTVVKLLVDAGHVCAEYQDRAFRNLRCRRVQVDEIWSFVYAKAKNVPTATAAPEGAGSVWTWTAIDADTKLVLSWLVGGRDAEYAAAFINDVSERIANRIQLTSDAHKPYLEAVENAFGPLIDYAQLTKVYGRAPESWQGKYSPTDQRFIQKVRISGRPNEDHISTSYVERQNLTMRMHMRRFTRLTNAFSKKVENHAHAVALHFMYYNFVRIHASLRVTPAMAAGVSKRLWEVSDIVGLIEEAELATDRKRGPYRKGQSS